MLSTSSRDTKRFNTELALLQALSRRPSRPDTLLVNAAEAITRFVAQDLRLPFTPEVHWFPAQHGVDPHPAGFFYPGYPRMIFLLADLPDVASIFATASHELRHCYQWNAGQPLSDEDAASYSKDLSQRWPPKRRPSKRRGGWRRAGSWVGRRFRPSSKACPGQKRSWPKLTRT